MPVYIVTRDCCLGPCCGRGHAPGKQIRVEQLRTTKKELAERCVKNWSTHRHPYKAVLEEK